MRIILYPAITLDGFIAHEDGNSDWVSEADDKLYQAEIKKAGCTIVGRNTYEQYKDDFHQEGRTTFVCTTRPGRSTKNVIFVSGEPSQIIRSISEHGFDSAVLSGGGETNARFAKAGCITEMAISIYPLIFGNGIRLFGKHEDIKLELELHDTKLLPDGIIQNSYKVL